MKVLISFTLSSAYSVNWKATARSLFRLTFFLALVDRDRSETASTASMKSDDTQHDETQPAGDKVKKVKVCFINKHQC